MITLEVVIRKVIGDRKHGYDVSKGWAHNGRKTRAKERLDESVYSRHKEQ